MVLKSLSFYLCKGYKRIGSGSLVGKTSQGSLRTGLPRSLADTTNIILWNFSEDRAAGIGMIGQKSEMCNRQFEITGIVSEVILVDQSHIIAQSQIE